MFLYLSEVPTSFVFFECIIWGAFLGIPFVIWHFREYFKKTKKRIGIVGVLFLGWGILGYGSFIEPQRLVLRQFQIQDSTLPTLRIAVISDLHAAPYKGQPYFQKIVNRINN